MYHNMHITRNYLVVHVYTNLISQLQYLQKRNNLNPLLEKCMHN